MVTIKVNEEKFDYQELKAALQDKFECEVKKSDIRNFGGMTELQIILPDVLQNVLHWALIGAELIHLAKQKTNSQISAENLVVTVVRQNGEEEMVKLKDLKHYAEGE